MSGINADRQKLIDAQVQNAVKAKIARTEELKKSSSATLGDFSVSIFVDNMSAEEKDYAYRKYAEGLLKTYDTVPDGKVTVEEFGQKEVADANAKPTDNSLIAKRVGFLSAENLDVNADGVVSIDEFTYFLKESDSEDDQTNYTQDGVITEKGEQSIYSQILGTNVNDEKLKAVTEKYLSGSALSEDEQKVLNDGSKTIRTAMSKRANDYFETDLGEAKDKNVYVQGGSDVTAIFEDFTNQTQSFMSSFFSGSMLGGSAPAAGSTTVTVEGQTKTNSNTIGFLANNGASNGSGIYGAVDLGMGFGNILGYGNNFRMGGSPMVSADSSAGKWWNIGNIFGQGLGIFGMLKGMFGSNNHNNCYGGLGWWFNRIG